MILGILALIVASLLFGAMPSICKLIMLDGVSSFGLAFYQFGFSTLLSFLIGRMVKAPLRINRKDLLHLGVIGLLGMGLTVLLLYTAYMIIPVGLATMVHFFIRRLCLLQCQFSFMKSLRLLNSSQLFYLFQEWPL